MSKKIKIIIGSVRESRKADVISEWVVNQAKEQGVELEVLDLKSENLSMFSEPASPMYVPVETEEGKRWASKIDDADGLIFLTAEYNRSIPASLKNAIDYLYKEWEGKKAGIISYGYIDAGGSATKHLVDILNWVKLDIVEPKIAIALGQDTFDENGKIADEEKTFAEAKTQLTEMLSQLNQ